MVDKSIKITQARDHAPEDLGLIPGPGTVLEIWSLTSPFVGINLTCVILVASKTFEAVFCGTHSFSIACKRPMMEHLTQLQLSGVDLVMSFRGSLTFQLIVFVGEGEASLPLLYVCSPSS